MRKTLYLFLITLLTLLISCENFMNGSDVSDELDQMIDEANAKNCTLIVSQDTTMGSFLSSGDKTCKVGYSIEVQFTVKKELYVYRGLKAVSKSDSNINLSSYVQFTEIDGNDSRGVYKTQVKLLKASDDILIIPYCTLALNAIKDECRPDFYEGGREQDSTITIVFNQSVTPGDYFVPTITDAYGQSLSQHFEEPYFSNDYKTLYIPTVKDEKELLITDNTATKDVFVRIDLSQLKDEDGNPGSGTFLHKYRVNRTRDSIKPVITEAKLFSTSDTESKYYKALPSKDYTGWTEQDYTTYHVGGKLYVEFKGSDVGTGISGLYVEETVCKYSDGTVGNETVTNVGKASWDKTKEVWCIDYEMRTAFDGILKLDFHAQDFSGNKSDSKFTFYVLKDSTVETNNIYFDTEYNTLMPDGFSENPLSNSESQEEAEQNLVEFFKNMTVDQYGNQTVTFNLSDNSKDVYYVNDFTNNDDNYSTNYDVEVYWGYSEDSIVTKAARNVDGKFTFVRNVDRFVFIKADCTDQVGNSRSIIKRMLPRLELDKETSEDDGRTTTNLIIKDLDSLMALSGDSQEFMSPLNICYLIQYDAEYTVNGNEKTISKAEIYAGPSDPILNSVEGDLSSLFISTCMQIINLPEDIMGVNQNGSVKIYAMPVFGDFPVPCSTSTVNYTITKIAKNEATVGTGRIGQFNRNQDSFNIYGSGPELSNVNASSGNSTTQETAVIEDFGPINPNASIKLVSILNSGFCKIVITDYQTQAEQYKNHNIVYTFTPLLFDASSDGFNYPKSSSAYAIPEIYVRTVPNTLCGIHIEAYDKTNNKKYVPIPLPALGKNYSTIQAVYNDCASGVVLDLDQDVEPPYINTSLQTSIPGEDLMFSSYGAYRIAGITDGNFALENGKAEIDYYLIPNSNKSSPSAVHYTSNEIENYSAFKKSLYYKPNVNSVGGDPYIDFPYGNIKEGFYTLVIAPKDKMENKSLLCVPVLNTVKGEFIEDIKNHWIRTTNTNDDHTYKSYGWMLFFDTQGHDEIYKIERPDSYGYSINAYLQQISYNEWENTYSWNQTEEIFREQCTTERTDESGERYYDVSLDVSPYGLPWVRLKAYYGFNDSENQTVVGKGFYYTEYLYTGANDNTCFSKNCIEGLNGLQVMSDRPVFAHTMYCPDKLTKSSKDANAARIWETKGVETGIAVMNKSINEPAINYFNWDDPDPANNHAVGSETYSGEYLERVPSGCWYTTIFHFADGTVVMTDIKQK